MDEPAVATGVEQGTNWVTVETIEVVPTKVCVIVAVPGPYIVLVVVSGTDTVVGGGAPPVPVGYLVVCGGWMPVPGGGIGL